MLRLHPDFRSGHSVSAPTGARGESPRALGRKPVTFGLHRPALALVLSSGLWAPIVKAQPGIFEGSGDVGTVLHQGSVEYDASGKRYTAKGSGENVWAAADGFYFVWKKMSGDVSISADIAFATQTGEPHKKAMLMFRQSLDADSAYADVAAHVAGLTSLQSRRPRARPHTKYKRMSRPFRSASRSSSAAIIFTCPSRRGMDNLILPARR